MGLFLGFQPLAFLPFLIPFSALGSDDWCIRDPHLPPCGGQSGKCTVNFDGSLGGFVADTAYVEKKRSFLSWVQGKQLKNRPFIGIEAQVCDRAHVAGDAQVYERARVFGDAQVYDQARVFGDAQIYGTAQVRDRAWVFGKTQVFEGAQVFGSVRVKGDTWILARARVHGNLELSRGLIVGTVQDYSQYEVFITPSNLSNGPGTHLRIQEHAIDFFQDYRGSEAEAYRKLLDQRSTQSQNLSIIELLDEVLDIDDDGAEVNDDFESGYEICCPKLASELSLVLNRVVREHDVISQSEIGSNLEAASLFSQCLDNEYNFQRYAFPKGVTDSLDQRALDYLNWIRTMVSNRIQDLNHSDEARNFSLDYEKRGKYTGVSKSYDVRYFQNPSCQSKNGIRIYYQDTPEYRYMKIFFFKMMDAIRDNSEEKFLEYLINLATCFHPSVMGARNGFIETYSYLYVAKKFMNRANRNRYLHFTLQCGGIT